MPGSTVAAPGDCPVCRRALPASVADGYCAACHHAWLRCQKCGAPASSLWRCCPSDGEPLVEPPASDLPLRFASELATRVLFSPSVRMPPRPAAGYLWTIAGDRKHTKSSEILRLGPLDTEPTRLNRDRPEYGYGPFAIVAATSSRRPVMVIVGTRRIALVDLAAGAADAPFKITSESLPSLDNVRGANGQFTRTHTFVSSHPHAIPEAMPGEDREDVHAAVSFDGVRFGALMRKHDESSDRLVLWRQGQPFESYALPEAHLSGPVVVGGRFCVYSRRKLYWVDGGRLDFSELPDFVPVDSRAFQAQMSIPPGVPPFVVQPAGAYFPGTVGNRPGFLFVRWADGRPALESVTLEPGATYSPRGDNGLLITSSGRVQQLTGTILSRPVAQSSAIVPGPAIVAGGNVIACCKERSGDLELRVFPGGRSHVVVPAGRRPVNLFLLPGFLVMTAWLGSQVEVLSWPLIAA